MQGKVNLLKRSFTALIKNLTSSQCRKRPKLPKSENIDLSLFFAKLSTMSKKHKKINARSITEAKKAQQPRAVSFAAVPVVADLPKSAQILTKKEIQLP